MRQSSNARVAVFRTLSLTRRRSRYKPTSHHHATMEGRNVTYRMGLIRPTLKKLELAVETRNAGVLRANNSVSGV
jgi:hypothetical protein